jgi:cysteine desulfurase
MCPIFLDNQATTPTDPRVVEAMLPYFTEYFGNPASTSHEPGRASKRAADEARESIAAAIGASAREVVFTSGATESNNLAIRGIAEHPARRGSHIVSVATEHLSVLNPLQRLTHLGFDVTLLPVIESPDAKAGLIHPEQVAEAISDRTILVSVMLANNEIGAIQPLSAIGRICRQRGVLLHTDATQAVGKIPVDVGELQVDLMSFSAHKLYGPKGIGVLYVRRRGRPVRLEPLFYGGNQEGGLRSGTLNVPGIVGLARALELCRDELPTEMVRLGRLRDRLCQGLSAGIPGTSLNGPALTLPGFRLFGNLNLSFAGLEGETLISVAGDLALSSASACSSAVAGPSHVLQALGIGLEAAQGSVRFGLGRFNTAEEVEQVIGSLRTAAEELVRLAS